MRRVGAAELTVLMGAWITVCWIGADMYLPAMPLMDEVFGAKETSVTLTLLTFNLGLPLGAIVGGPISDKVGRRGPTLLGGIVFAAAAAACACAQSLPALVVLRALQGMGGGVVTATAMAVLEDVLEGEVLERAVSVTQSLAVFGPIVAPFLGSLMLGLVGWRGVFGLMAVLGAGCVAWYLRVGETLPPGRRVRGGVLHALGNIFRVGGNPQFLLLLVVCVMPALAFGVFITTSSYVYIDHFGLSNLEFSVLYGLASVASMAGPWLYARSRARVGDRRVIIACVASLIVSGAVILAAGGASPGFFLAGTLLFSLAEGTSRPCAYLVLLRAERERAGAASALIGFGVEAACGLGTPLAMLPWGDYVTATGAPILLSSVVALVLLGALLLGMRSTILDQAPGDELA